MATTSLARQLEQLRATTTADPQQQKFSVAQQGPNILSVQLSGEQLTLLAKDAFAQLCDTCPTIAQFKNAIFKGDQDDFENEDSDEDMDDGESSSHNLEDLLFLLSPHILAKPTQYLLQYLISKLKIHRKYPETLFFVTLPYNQYAIFNKIVECLPIRETTSEQEDHPRWVQHFRLACHPATTVGLHRHLACDRGFFNLLCNLMLRLMKQHLPKYGSEEGVDYNKIIHFFVTSIVSSLNLCNTVSEHQTLDLMRIIVAGLKCNKNSDPNAVECRALASIVFAYLVPRVQLKSKVCSKLLKVLSKMCKKQELTTDTLTLVAILYRCQRSSIADLKTKVLELILKHDAVMMDVMENADRKEEDEKQFAKRLQKASALLLDDVSESGLVSEISQLLRMIFQSMVQCSPTSESAEILIASVSKIQVDYNQKLKKLKKKLGKHSENVSVVDKEGLNNSIVLCNKILDSLRKNFVEEFSRKSNLNAGKDIFFMDNESELPTPEQISVKRILMDNPLIQRLMNEIDLNPIHGKELSSNISKDDVKDNAKNIKAIFGLVKPDFLLRQIQPDKLVSLVIGLVKLYENQPKTLTKILSFVSSDAFQNDANIKREIDVRGVDLTLLIFHQLFSTNENVRSVVFDQIKKLAKVSTSPLASLVSKLNLNPEGSLEKLFAQIRGLTDFEVLSYLMTKMFDCKVFREPELITIVLILGASILENFRSKDKGIVLSQHLIALALVAVECCKTAGDENADVTNPKLVEKSDKSVDLVSTSNKKKAVPAKVLQKICGALKSLPKFCSDPQSQLESSIQIFVLGSSLRAALHESAAEKAFEIFSGKDFQLLLARISAMKMPKQIFSIKNVEMKSGKLESLFSLAQLHCSKQISANLEMDKLAALLPYLLTALTTENKKVRKTTFKCFEQVLGQSSKKVKSAAFLPLLQHLVDHKAEIVSNVVNLSDVLSEFSGVESNEDVLNNLLGLIIGCENTHVFTQLCPLLSSLKSSSSMEKISKFGLKLLSEESNSESSESLSVLLDSFLSSVLKQSADPTCWELVTKSVSCHTTTVSHNNIDKSVGVLALEAIYPASKKLKDNSIVEKLFGLLIDQSGNCVASDVLMLARKIAGVLKGLTSKIFLTKLGSIWGEKLIREEQGQAGGRFSVRSASQVDLDKNWKMTLFLLEVGLDRLDEDAPASLPTLLRPLGILLKEALDQTEQNDNSYQLDLLLSSTLFIMDKAGPNSLNEKSINPELMVRCIRTCQNPNTKATALLILAKSSAANPEYILHNSIPIFTFMGTHFLKIDAKHSFDVACQAIDVIIPHIQSVCLAKHTVNGPKKMAETSLNILHTFADASVDMPHPHRVKTFMFKLLSKLGVREYTWILTLLLLKKIETTKPKKSQSRQVQFVENKLEQLRELYSMFGCDSQIHAVHKILTNLKEDSSEMKQIFGAKTTKSATSQPDPEQTKAENILRVHSMAFTNHLLTSRHFVDQVSKRLQEVENIEEERTLMYRQLENLLEAAIVNTDHYEQMARSGNSKRQFVACCEKILEAILSLLPLEVFVRLLSAMLLNQRNSVRRKMLEVFNAKLQQSHEIVLDESSLQTLLEPLVHLATGEGESNPFNQQLALLCLRSFGRALGPVSPGPFNQVCKKLSARKFLDSLDNQAVKAATLLCLTELYQSLGPLSVPLLPPFIAWMLELMSDTSIVKDNVVVLNSIILSVQKCMDNFGGFLNPYYKTFVVATCRLMKINDDSDVDEDRKSQATKNRLRHLCATISRSVPTHKLIDIASQCYDELSADTASSQSVIALSTILRENLAQLNKAQALAISTPCLRLFQHIFRYRQTHLVTKDLSTLESFKSVEIVENHFIETFLTLMLKLSLDDFKPIFYRLFNLSYAGTDNDDIDGMTTMFHITKSVAQKLKTLFAFICETLVQKTTTILNVYSKDDFAKMQNISGDETKIVDLVGHMLDALTVVFTHNQVESLLIKNYEEHVNAVLCHVEAPLTEANKDVLLAKIRECLGQLAVSTEDETQWKYLNYQVLLCIRNNDLKIRLFVLDVLELFLEKKGENYLTVLPDSVPLLAEALDDDNSKVEVKCRKLIKRMEEIFGHSVESYFE